MQTETATFAAGCFWGVEGRGRTGHAEAVRVEYDPGVISHDRLLDTFWEVHNPTTRNRQGWDIGSRYRSAIFTHDEAQRDGAMASRDARQRHLKRQIVTEIAPASRFWPAEEYHQQYLEKRGQAGCAVPVDAA